MSNVLATSIDHVEARQVEERQEPINDLNVSTAAVSQCSLSCTVEDAIAGMITDGR